VIDTRSSAGSAFQRRIQYGAGCIAPTTQTIADGTYAPLSRPLYIYVNLEDLTRPEVQEFLCFALTRATPIVSSVGYVPLPPADYAKNLQQLDSLVS